MLFLSLFRFLQKSSLHVLLETEYKFNYFFIYLIKSAIFPESLIFLKCSHTNMAFERFHFKFKLCTFLYFLLTLDFTLELEKQ